LKAIKSKNKSQPVVWAIVTARGGSKSIPLKNLVLVNKTPLLDYGVLASRASQCFDRIICSTEDKSIKKRALELGIEVDYRPESLCGDDISSRAVIKNLLMRTKYADIPDLVAIIQPTSIFLRPADIRQLLDRMILDSTALSGQTLARPPHNHHAWNQRQLSDGRVSFYFEERKKAFNKQRKPDFYIFGNLVMCRSQSLLDGNDVFAEPSAAVEIEWPYDFDLDGPNDLKVAEVLLTSGVVKLDHMSKVKETES
jgi:CMP-N,N'-diacetyllegionaminic acid synthase